MKKRTQKGPGDMSLSFPLIAEAERAELEDSSAYRSWNIARYGHWIVRLNARDQGLPGRMVVWLKRHVDCMGFEETSKEESEEFKQILRDIDRAVKTLWPACCWLNVEWLGNQIDEHRGHGHFHVTPRFASPVVIGNREFMDIDHTKRRQTPKLELPGPEALHIRNLLRSFFKGYPF